MRIVKVTATAEEDLRAIWEYVAQHDTEAAGKIVKEITRKFSLLRDYPNAGREQHNLLVNLRSLVVRDYLIFYQPIFKRSFKVSGKKFKIFCPKNKMPENVGILNEIKSLHEKFDRVLLLLEEIKAKNTKAPRPSKPKPVPLTQEDIELYQLKFNSLYEKWLSGQELEVQADLDKFSAEDIRRFADANNLNVTSKSPKEKVLQLIGARFREKKQLFRGVSSHAQETHNDSLDASAEQRLSLDTTSES